MRIFRNNKGTTGHSSCFNCIYRASQRAHAQAVAAGAVSRTSPRSSPDGDCVVSEVLLYGDTVLRFVSGACKL
eukprot:6180316-Pleurochrysis_carterae.AAC.2